MPDDDTSWKSGEEGRESGAPSKTITLDEIMDNEGENHDDHDKEIEEATETKMEDDDDQYHEIFVNEIRRKEQLE